MFLITVQKRVNIQMLTAEEYSNPWAMCAQLKSPAYTTRWSDLPTVSM